MDLTKRESHLIAQYLQSQFPWLDNDDVVDGADVVEDLKEIYLSLTDGYGVK